VSSGILLPEQTRFNFTILRFQIVPSTDSIAGGVEFF
jgi:hypothetical protein